MHSKMLENVTVYWKNQVTGEMTEVGQATEAKVVYDAEGSYICEDCDGLGFIRHVGSQYENGELIVDCMTCEGTGDAPEKFAYSYIKGYEAEITLDAPLYDVDKLQKPKEEFFIQGQKTGLDLIYAMAGYFNLNDILYDNVLGSYFKSVTVQNKVFEKMLKGAAKLAEVQQ